jgi:hypothetical protein
MYRPRLMDQAGLVRFDVVHRDELWCKLRL